MFEFCLIKKDSFIDFFRNIVNINQTRGSNDTRNKIKASQHSARSP